MVKTMSDVNVTPAFKSVTIDDTVYVDETSFKEASIQSQVSFITAKTKEGLEVKVSQFPAVSLWNTQQLLESYIKQPLLTLGALRLALPSDEKLEEALTEFENNLAAFSESLTSLREVVKTSYVFAEVPPTFNFDSKFKVLSNRIRRIADAGHFLSYNDVKTLMNKGLKYWSSNPTETLELGRITYQQHGTWWRTTFHPTYLTIGCQTIQRYELEAMAIKLGFTGQAFENVRELSY